MKIGVGIGIPFVGKAGEAFTPTGLFLNGEQGVWYDASDLSTLFQDAAGTTPVTAVGQPVGLHRDKSGNGNHRAQTDTAKRPTLGQDENGNYFLLYDGASRFLVTEDPVDFTATDEMSSFVGVRKLSDALQATVFELSASATSGNPGSFTLQAPSGPATDTYRYTGGGTTSRSSSWTGYPAPTTNVVTYLQKISGPLIRPRIDTQEGPPNVTEQGTGNFGTYQLFFGSRGGTTFFFNGREYQTVICGRICTPSEISKTERFINARTRAYWRPINTTAPVVSGTPRVGQTLTTTDGTWDAAPAVSGYTYQWLSNGQPVGTNANTYVLAGTDRGKSVSCRVTATNPIGSASSDSLPLGPILQLPTNTTAPSIPQAARVGVAMLCNPGVWVGFPTPTITGYQWRKGGTPISGATASSYTPVQADAGGILSCLVTASNSVGPASAASNNSDAVLAPPVNATPPSIPLDARVGVQMTCNPGTWTGHPTISYAYQWRKGGVNIGGATASTYTPQAGDIGGILSCLVTASNSVGSVPLASNNSNAVTPSLSPPVNTSPPNITGSPTVGWTLTCNRGSWTGYPDPTYAYAWTSDGTAVGTNSPTYVPDADDVGNMIACTVTASNSEGSADAAAPPVGPVEPEAEDIDLGDASPPQLSSDDMGGASYGL